MDQPTPADQPKKRVLLIDDEPAILKMIGRRLEVSGYEVDLAFDGEDGLRRARTQRYDLIVLDLMLPKINGFDVCRQLKQDTERAAVPIIIYTARGQEIDKICETCGADVVVHKSPGNEDLVQRIKDMLGKTPA